MVATYNFGSVYFDTHTCSSPTGSFYASTFEIDDPEVLLRGRGISIYLLKGKKAYLLIDSTTVFTIKECKIDSSNNN